MEKNFAKNRKQFAFAAQASQLVGTILICLGILDLIFLGCSYLVPHLKILIKDPYYLNLTTSVLHDICKIMFGVTLYFIAYGFTSLIGITDETEKNILEEKLSGENLKNKKHLVFIMWAMKIAGIIFMAAAVINFSHNVVFYMRVHIPVFFYGKIIWVTLAAYLLHIIIFIGNFLLGYIFYVFSGAVRSVIFVTNELEKTV